MKISDWLTIAAIISGPVLALLVQRILDNLREAKQRKLDVFRSLMTSRGTRLAPRFVEALNLIDLEFKGEAPVLNAWKELQDHYFEWGQKSDAESAAEAKELNNRAVELLSDLLMRMGSVVGYSFDKVFIKKGFYYPKGLVNVEQEQHALRQSLLKVFNGQSLLPVAVFEKKFPHLTIEPLPQALLQDVPIVQQSLEEPKD
jgi:hypothetical protein